MQQSELARGKEGSATLVPSIARSSEFLSEFDAYLGTASRGKYLHQKIAGLFTDQGQHRVIL